MNLNSDHDKLIIELNQLKSEYHNMKLILEDKHIMQQNTEAKNEMIINELTDIQSKYNQAFLDLQSLQQDKLKYDDQITKLNRKLLIFEENRNHSERILQDKEQLIQTLTNDFEQLKQNLLIIKQKNYELDSEFKKTLI